MPPLAWKAGNVNVGAVLIFPQQVTKLEPSRWFAAMIQEDALLGLRSRSLSTESAQLGFGVGFSGT
jgi:hypothetical protein